MCEKCQVVENELESLYQDQPQDEVPEFDATNSTQPAKVPVK
jgi:hypothetical protein